MRHLAGIALALILASCSSEGLPIGVNSPAGGGGGNGGDGGGGGPHRHGPHTAGPGLAGHAGRRQVQDRVRLRRRSRLSPGQVRDVDVRPGVLLRLGHLPERLGLSSPPTATSASAAVAVVAAAAAAVAAVAAGRAAVAVAAVPATVARPGSARFIPA